MNDFDVWAKDYKKVINKTLKISGADSDFFAKYKVDEVSLRLKDVPESILDVGCGVGAADVFFRGLYQDAKIVGIDVSAQSIEFAGRQGLDNASYLVYDGYKFPVESESFSVVFCATVLHHVLDDENRKQLLAEMYRVLKSGGNLFIFEHNPLNPGTKIITNNEVDKDARLLKIKETVNLVNSQPFVGVKIYNTCFIPRFRLLKPFFALEKYLYSIPCGAQYYIHASRNQG